MKKVFLFLVLIAAVLWAGLAEAAPPTPQDTQQLLSAIKDVRYHVEAGVNFATYRDVVTRAGVEQRKFADKYPDYEFLGQINKIMIAYNDAGTIWKNAIYDLGKSVVVESPAGSYLSRTYPSVLTGVRIHENRTTKGAVLNRWWWYEDLMPELWRIAATIEKEIAQ